ncbi:hypothetical protein DFH08DRAFT_643429, partial [Mycena albidolilacea]
PNPPPPVDPMAQPAVSATNKLLIDRVQLELMKIEMQTCNSCNERGFDLDVKDGKCDKCRKKLKFHASNQMDPGSAANLPNLTQIEEMIISPVH